MSATVTESGEGRRRSLANLAPPWQPGRSGNPAGRPRGSRNQRSAKAEQIGRALIGRSPDAATLLRCPPLNDKRKLRRWLHRVAVSERAELERRGDVPADMIRAAVERAVLARLAPLVPLPRRGDGSRCLHCNRHVAEQEAVPLYLGLAGLAGWCHAQCVGPAMQARVAAARKLMVEHGLMPEWRAVPAAKVGTRQTVAATPALRPLANILPLLR